MFVIKKVAYFHRETISWSANARNVLGSSCLFVERLRHLATSLWLYFSGLRRHLYQPPACIKSAMVQKMLESIGILNLNHHERTQRRIENGKFLFLFTEAPQNPY